VDEVHVRHELDSALAARRELGADLEPQLVASFVDRIEKEIDRRVDERLATRPQPAARVPLALPLGSMALAIPITGIAVGNGEAWLAGFAWLVIAIVNVAYALRR
jgi:hypothetical protein